MKYLKRPHNRVAITGAAGLVGKSLATELLQEDNIELLLIDRVFPKDFLPSSKTFHTIKSDLRSDDWCQEVEKFCPDTVFHLAASVSAETEADPSAGFLINVDVTKRLIDQLGLLRGTAAFVLASSVAAYPSVTNAFAGYPGSSYGIQKLIAEAIVADATRRGAINGVSLRLPTVIVRPGAPNRAASSFLSDIVREPHAGRTAVLPVAEHTEAWVTSPAHTVKSLIYAAKIAESGVLLPALPGRGRRVSVAEILSLLSVKVGLTARDLVKLQLDRDISDIVSRWPVDIDCQSSEKLGFPEAPTLQQIIDEFLGQVSINDEVV